MPYGIGRRQIGEWFRDYVKLQSMAVTLIHVQIGCALIGSLGALYNGALLASLCISLFALVAIESSSQNLARTYAVLLFFSVLIDVAWFFLFSQDIWHISSDTYGTYARFSAKVTLVVQIIGFAVKFLSSILWIQMYRLGASYIDSSVPRDTDADLRNSFLNPATPIYRRPSGPDDFNGSSAYSPQSEDGRIDNYMLGISQNHFALNDSASTAEASRFGSPGRTFRAKEVSQNHLSLIDSSSTAETSRLSSPSRTFRAKEDETSGGKFQII